MSNKKEFIKIVKGDKVGHCHPISLPHLEKVGWKAADEEDTEKIDDGHGSDYFDVSEGTNEHGVPLPAAEGELVDADLTEPENGSEETTHTEERS